MVAKGTEEAVGSGSRRLSAGRAALISELARLNNWRGMLAEPGISRAEMIEPSGDRAASRESQFGQAIPDLLAPPRAGLLLPALLFRRHPYLVPRNIVERRKGPRDGLSIKAAGHCPVDQLTRPVALSNGYGHPVAISLFGN